VLSVTVGMAGAFACFCIGLQTEAQTLQEPANQLLASAEAQVGQRRGQMALALAHPHQGTFRIAADCGLHQVIQGFQKPRLCLGRWLAATPSRRTRGLKHHCARTQVFRSRDQSCCAQSPSPAIPQRPRHVRPHAPHRPRTTAALSLVQNWLKRLEASLDGGGNNHSVRISAPAAESRQFPDSFRPIRLSWLKPLANCRDLRGTNYLSELPLPPMVVWHGPHDSGY
jgi:hypothetical protein